MSEYGKALEKNSTVQRLRKRAADGKATSTEMSKLVGACGDVAGECIIQQLRDEYPNGQIEEADVRRIISPILRELHRVVSSFAEKMTNAQYEQAGVGLKAIVPAYDIQRENDLVKELSQRSFSDEFLE